MPRNSTSLLLMFANKLVMSKYFLFLRLTYRIFLGAPEKLVGPCSFSIAYNFLKSLIAVSVQSTTNGIDVDPILETLPRICENTVKEWTLRNSRIPSVSGRCIPSSNLSTDKIT